MLSSLTRSVTGSALTAFALLAVSLPASAQIQNGSFETNTVGSFTISGWNAIGSTYVTDASFGDTPTNGSQQAFLNNDPQAYVSYGPQSNHSVSVSDLNSFFGLSGSALNGLGNGTVTDGSGIKQTFTLTKAGTLSFDYDFVTSEDRTDPALFHDDFAFVSLTGTKSALAGIADSASASVLEPPQTGRTSPSIDDYLSETGYQTYTTTLGLGVANVGDTQFGSGLLVDNVHFAPVPEAGTSVSFAFLLGLGGLLMIRRKHAGAKA